MKIVPIYGGSIFSTKYWNNKVLFTKKTALLKNKIITILKKRLHKSFVCWNKKVRWSTPLIHCFTAYAITSVRLQLHNCRLYERIASLLCAMRRAVKIPNPTKLKPFMVSGHKTVKVYSTTPVARAGHLNTYAAIKEHATNYATKTSETLNHQPRATVHRKFGTQPFFAARCHAEARPMPSRGICPSVRPSVCHVR